MKLKVTLLFAALLAAACAGASAKETIVFWYGAKPDELPAYKRLVSDFEKANPDIKVNALLVPQKYVERKLILSVAGGVPPDVVRFYTHIGGEMMSRGGLEPLDDLIKRDKLNLPDFYPVGLTQNTYQGKLYGLPWVLSPYVLFYNKALFREVGLDPTKPPTTWRELEDYAIRLTKRAPDGSLERVGYADFLYNPPNFAMYVWQSGGELLSDDGKAPAFDSPKGVRALSWMKSFVEREAGSVRELQVFSSGFQGDERDPFGLGQLAMRIDSPFRIPVLKRIFPKLDYGVSAIPYNTQRASEVVGNSLVIPRGSLHREAAWKFIKFAVRQDQMSRICLAAGRIPSRISAAHRPEFYDDPIMKVFVDQIPYGRTIPVAPGWQETGDALTRQIEAALKGQKTPAKALASAASAARVILARSNEDVNRMPPVPWLALGIAAGAILCLAAVGTGIYVSRKTRHSARERREARNFYLFASPWILGFIVLTFGATVASLIISFSKWDALSAARFVGVRNYADLFTADARFYKAIFVTFYYALFSVPLAIVGGLTVSVLLNQKLFGTRIFRTIYYIPVVVSGVATAVLWQYIFNPKEGLLNKLLTMNVVPWFSDGHVTFVPAVSNPPQWLLDPSWAMPAFIIMGLWSVGGSMVIYLAALQGVPEELYEAARIDGAGAWKTFRNVTLPLITPAIFYQLVVGTMYSLQMFTQPYMMTNGGPEDATLFYALYLFKNAFEWMKMGYASAMAWVLFGIVMLITLVQMRTAARWVYYEGVKEE